MVATMLVVATLVFIVTNLIPGSPAALILGEDRTPEQVVELNRELGLDRPAAVRFVLWAGQLIRGDFGRSLFNDRSVAQVIYSRLEPTILLTLSSAAIAVLIGIPLGILAAVYQRTVLDLGAMAVALVGAAIPNFWLGLLLILAFALRFKMFPSAGYTSLSDDPGATWRYLVLPAITLGVSHAGVIARMSRANLLEVLQTDYVRTARSKGLRERVVVNKHAFRNALVPTLSVVGIALALMIGGSVITESVFAVPGVGRLLIESVLRRDFPMIQGVILLIAMLVALVNLLVDLTYALLDPRIRYG